MILAQLSWPEIASDLHLSLWTGTAILSDIARWIEQRLSDKVLLAPPQSAGFYHARFGCLNLDLNTYIGFIGGICRSFAAMCTLKTEMPQVRGCFGFPLEAGCRSFQPNPYFTTEKGVGIPRSRCGCRLPADRRIRDRGVGV